MINLYNLKLNSVEISYRNWGLKEKISQFQSLLITYNQACTLYSVQH